MWEALILFEFIYFLFDTYSARRIARVAHPFDFPESNIAFGLC